MVMYASRDLRQDSTTWRRVSSETGGKRDGLKLYLFKCGGVPQSLPLVWAPRTGHWGLFGHVGGGT